MRPSSILALALLLSLLASPALGTPADDPRPIVPASEILAKIERGEPVEYDGVIVEGDLDLGEVRLPKVHTNKSRHEVKYLDLTEESKIISSSISIKNSKIFGNTNFREGIFQKTVCFYGTNFSDNATFVGAQFSGDAELGGVQFNKYAGFGGTWFKEGANFESVQLGGYADFRGAQFSKNIKFETAQFMEYADFRSAQFGGSANFRNVRFSENAHFESAQFNGDARFEGAQFYRDARFTLVLLNINFAT